MSQIKTGEKLPSQKELIADYSLAPATVTKVLKSLCEMGYAFRLESIIMPVN